MAKKRQKMLIWGQAKSQKVTQLFEEASLSSVVDVNVDVNVVVFHRFVVSSFRRRRRRQPSFDDFFLEVSYYVSGKYHIHHFAKNVYLSSGKAAQRSYLLFNLVVQVSICFFIPTK